jgi:hypothetical protein
MTDAEERAKVVVFPVTQRAWRRLRLSIISYRIAVAEHKLLLLLEKRRAIEALAHHNPGAIDAE